jgi:succinylglutamic semialdehyde dehydrogenase
LAARAERLESFGEQVGRSREEFARAISRETGKPLWESLSEVGAVVAKIGLTRQAWDERCRETSVPLGSAAGGIRYRPQGVVAVFGPFNLPAHLPNGHLVPALLAGNAAVFKPSELTPGVGEAMVRLWEASGLPPGILNLVQGGAETGKALVDHPGVDGVFFTGSYETGRAIHQALGGRPEVLVALEMGGNNPLVVWNPKDAAAAAVQVVLSAFITTGQRCTCARRLILPRGPSGDDVVGRVVERARRLRVGPWTNRPEPFCGPVISPRVVENLLEAQQVLLQKGALPLLPMERRGPALLSPGLLDVSEVSDRPDRELFGPLLQVIRVPDFAAALEEANRTAFGLSAGILTDDRARYEAFLRGVRAGVVHWNRPTTGASGRLPFGGEGRSGNFRPAGYHAVDYCAHAVATLESDTVRMPEGLPPGIDGH